MPVYREQIAQRIKGSLAEREDWWTLCYDSNADTFYVEHQWDHMNPYKLGEEGSRGTTRYDADDWTGEGTDAIAEAKVKLKAKAGA